MPLAWRNYDTSAELAQSLRQQLRVLQSVFHDLGKRCRLRNTFRVSQTPQSTTRQRTFWPSTNRWSSVAVIVIIGRTTA